MEKENKINLERMLGYVSSLQPHPATEIAIIVLHIRYRNKQKNNFNVEFNKTT